MSQPFKVTKIDGVNFVERQIETNAGPITLPGLTVRALRKALEGVDPDAMVAYIAEQGEGVVFGCIGGITLGPRLCFLVGPEVAKGLRTAQEALDAGQTVMEVPADPPPPVDRSNTTTTNGQPLDQRPETDDKDGQHSNYLVLSEEERMKGFVRPVRDAYIHEVCGKVTTMSRSLAETYARDPKFYGSTYCQHCKGHFPVGEDGEFFWHPSDDMKSERGDKVGT